MKTIEHSKSLSNILLLLLLALMIFFWSKILNMLEDQSVTNRDRR